MFCINCGNKIKEEETFCSNCGKANVTEPVKSLESSEKLITNDKWWIRLLKVLYIALHLPLLLIIPIVWSSNTRSCYSYYATSCSGSNSQAFWYSILTLIIYMVIVRLIKLATMYVAMGRKPNWKKEFKKFF